MGLTAKDFDQLVQLKEQASMKIETLGQFLLTRDGTSINQKEWGRDRTCLLYTSPSPRDQRGSRMPSSA